MSRKSPKSIYQFPSLTVPLIQHVLASDNILIRSDRIFIDSLLQSLVNSVEDATPASVEPAVAQFVKRLTQFTADNIPSSILTILNISASYASRLPNIAYPSGLLSKYEKSPPKAQSETAICMFLDSLIRLGFAESLLRKALQGHTRWGKDPTLCLAVGNLLKQLGSAVWRLPKVPRFHLTDSKAAGSDDREEFLLTQATILWKWISEALILQLPKSGIQTNQTEMPNLGLKAMENICDYIVGLDGAIWRGEFDISESGAQLERYTVEDLTERTRNYDRMVLVAMTRKNRETPIGKEEKIK